MAANDLCGDLLDRLRRPIIDTNLARPWVLACRIVAWITWTMFAVDYLARLILADNRRRYASRHLLDLVIIALPLLRPLRLLRLVSLLNVLHRRASTALRGRIAAYVAGGSLLIAFCGALAVLDAERANPEANIKTFGDVIWWAFTTMTTVGYGDRYPTTTVGRLAAVGLMISGIALLGVVTATFASWLIEQVAQTEDKQTSELRAEIAVLSNKLDRLIASSDASRSSQPRKLTA
jgi:voltage-gated potassium channel